MCVCVCMRGRAEHRLLAKRRLLALGQAFAVLGDLDLDLRDDVDLPHVRSDDLKMKKKLCKASVSEAMILAHTYRVGPDSVCTQKSVVLSHPRVTRTLWYASVSTLYTFWAVFLSPASFSRSSFSACSSAQAESMPISRTCLLYTSDAADE